MEMMCRHCSSYLSPGWECRECGSTCPHVADRQWFKRGWVCFKCKKRHIFFVTALAREAELREAVLRGDRLSVLVTRMSGNVDTVAVSPACTVRELIYELEKRWEIYMDAFQYVGLIDTYGNDLFPEGLTAIGDLPTVSTSTGAQLPTVEFRAVISTMTDQRGRDLWNQLQQVRGIPDWDVWSTACSNVCEYAYECREFDRFIS